MTASRPLAKPPLSEVGRNSLDDADVHTVGKPARDLSNPRRKIERLTGLIEVKPTDDWVVRIRSIRVEVNDLAVNLVLG